MNSRIVTFRFRLSDEEHRQLLERAQREGDTVSELIREALYRRYGIGSMCVPETISNGCTTPRT